MDRLDELARNPGIVRRDYPDRAPALVGGNETDAELRTRLAGPLELEPGTLSTLYLEATPPDRVFGVAEFLQPDGSWHALPLLAFKPENDGFTYQLVGESWGWLPASDVRGFVLAKGDV